jgi:hypothetical protein
VNPSLTLIEDALAFFSSSEQVHSSAAILPAIQARAHHGHPVVITHLSQSKYTISVLEPVIGQRLDLDPAAQLVETTSSSKPRERRRQSLKHWLEAVPSQGMFCVHCADKSFVQDLRDSEIAPALIAETLNVSWVKPTPYDPFEL